MDSSIEIPRLISLPKVEDPRGNLTFLEKGRSVIPFDFQRVYWTYDVPTDSERGGHAHHSCAEFLVAVCGSFRINLFDGHDWTTRILDSPDTGLLLPPGYWRTLDLYAPGSVSLALASEVYDEADYIRDFDEFVELKKAGRL